MDVIICSGCQKQYNWIAKYAGKKVRCKCGQSMLMPAAEDELALDELTADEFNAPDAPQTGAYDVALDPVELAAPTRRAHSMAAPAKRVASDRALEDPDADIKLALSDRYMPLGVLIGGVLMQLVVLLYGIDSAVEAVISWMVLILVEAIIFSPLALVSMFIAAKIQDMSFGPLLVGIYKMTAITIGGGGLADIIFLAVADMGEFRTRSLMAIAFLINLLFVGAPASVCFKLEAGEASTLVITIIVMRFLLLLFIAMMFL